MADAPFEPIAIVGRGCVVPGALSPDALWRAVVAKADLLQDTPEGRFGLTERESARVRFRGGYVTGFETVFDPGADDLGGVDPMALDVGVRWLLHAGRAAWAEAGIDQHRPKKTGVIVGNLGYPSRAFCDLMADRWEGREESAAAALNRANTGGPAGWLALALGAKGTAFALDAACASSLYAVKLACDRLHDRRLDTVVVGAMNAVDHLMLQQGFAALKASSPTGRSRPLMEGADGLVPAEGAVAIVLQRLCDVSPDAQVFGVIRGVGLSNDGRRKGLLVPDGDGQVEAMQRAWAMSGLDPARDIGLIEAHATGTPTGDGVELAASACMFGARDGLAIGSLKSNTGHLITAAGLASLIKVGEALARAELPPMRAEGEPLAAFADCPLAPALELSPWADDVPKRAGVSTFGFGGNNAHLILEADDGWRPERVKSKRIAPRADVVGVGLTLGKNRGQRDVVRALLRGLPERPRAQVVAADPVKLRTPPADLKGATAQQLAVFDVVEEALKGLVLPEAERVGCFVGFPCATESARWMWRERLAARLGLDPDGAEAQRLRDSIIAPLAAADVTGAMPNVSANRLNAAHDWRGQGFALMAEEESGAVALEVAMDTLARGELDLAVVAVADFTEFDGAAALVLRRAGDGAADAALAVLSAPALKPGKAGAKGHALRREGSAAGLISLVVDVTLGRRGLALSDEGVVPLTPAFRGRRKLPGGRIDLEVRPEPSGDAVRGVPFLDLYAAGDAESLLHEVSTRSMGFEGSVRLAILSRTEAEREVLHREAEAALLDGEMPSGEGFFAGQGEAEGDLAFVFTGAAAAYRGLGRGLFSAFPELAGSLAEVFPASVTYLDALGTRMESAFSQLCATTALSQAQHRLLTRHLGVSPAVAMGLSSGETNALMAFGAWRDPDALMADIAGCGMYERDLGGTFEVAREYWGETGAVDWQTWRVFAPVEAVRAALDGVARADLTIIYSAADVVISGTDQGCAAVLSRLGRVDRVRVPHDLIVHTPVMTPYAETWRALHARPTTAPKGVRFYANAIQGSYRPTKAKAADMLTRQALETVDFPATVEQAYTDGVRTFVEIGPRDTLSRAIGQILGDRSHRAVPMDRTDRSDLETLSGVMATLFADGRSADFAGFVQRLEAARANVWADRKDPKTLLTFPAHPEIPNIRRETETKMPSSIPLPTPPQRPGVTVRLAEREPERVAVPLSAGVVTVEPKAPEPQPKPQPQRKARPVTPPKRLPVPLTRRDPVGPVFGPEEIAFGAHGKLSEIFGEVFRQQDGFERQVRMPRAPLLLCDRITGIDAEPGVLGKGTIWTESDVTADHWAVRDGFIRLGPLVESGQADLALISWMGVDFLNKGERIYRLLGCELTFHEGGLPEVGDTLRFQIEITGHTELQGVRMFFISYDCWCNDRLLLSVRHGQAGFFTDAELAASKGVLWSAETEDAPTAEPRLDPVKPTLKRAFSAAEVAAFRRGDAFGCFGSGFEAAAAQSRPARIPDGRLALFDEIEAFEPEGGPWKRGYIRARQHVPVSAWFYDGHFHNDPCMPGTLMVEAAVQVLSFTMAGLGLTLARDSHVFEPVPDAPAQFICRGQVIPDAPHEVTYEIFIDEIVDGPVPMVFASLLASSDGKKVFYCPRFGLRLRPHWPRLAGPDHVARIVGPSGDVRGDDGALIEMASGAPSRALGSMYAKFDRAGRLPRLPSPPYHMVSRILSAEGDPGRQEAGVSCVAEYDVPPEAWYFRDSGNGHMPLAVLTEIALQPCGWLAGYAGLALGGDSYFRNLDGSGQVLAEVGPEVGALQVQTTLSRISKVGPLIIVFYDLSVTAASGETVMTLSTSFGFFNEASLAAQAGLKMTDAHRAMLEVAGAEVALPEGGPDLPDGRMGMLDKVDLWEPEGGAAGLGRIRGRQAVDPYAWYFRAHFFSDPVQPGSLGLDALAQLLMRAVQLNGLAEGIANPRFETVASGEPIRWTYRGQVTPKAREVTTVVDVLAVEDEADGTRLVRASGTLFVDGLRIYEMAEFAIRIRPDARAPVVQETVSAAVTPWLDSHRPTHTLPALPLMAMAGMAARAAATDNGTREARFPVEVTAFKPRAWAIVPDEGLELATRVEDDGRVSVMGRAADADSVPVERAGGMARRTRAKPKLTFSESGAGRPESEALYESGDLFHGADLQPVKWLKRDASGFEMEIDLKRAGVKGDAFDPVILDGLVHGVPHQSSGDWFPLEAEGVIYPVEIERMVVHGPLPKSGKLTVRGAPKPGAKPPSYLPIRIEAFTSRGPYMELDLVEKAFPKGPFAVLDPRKRRDFIKGKRKKPYAVLSRAVGEATLLSPSDVIACDWLPGSVAATYGADGLTGTELVKAVAVKEHFALKWKQHPATVLVEAPFASHGKKRGRYDIRFDRAAKAWRVTSEGA